MRKVVEILGKDKIIDRVNRMVASGKPFMFMIDFNATRAVVESLDDLLDSDILLSVNGKLYGNRSLCSSFAESVSSECCTTGAEIYDNVDVTTVASSTPPDYSVYKSGFDNVMKNISDGNTYLLNLTYASGVGEKIDLSGVFSKASSKYKLLWHDKFVFYSPEPFIKISKMDNKFEISSFPMKGTIRALDSDAGRRLIEDYKELCEHYTIVDLIRNDLSVVSKDVRVKRFRYLDLIKTERGYILQTSSHISGVLPDDWRGCFGNMLFKMLPAGSISGAPKERTVEIIKQSEISERGYYTGIMGVYNDGIVDSCVIIRYIEKGDNGYYYRSGGGITSKSCCESEYDELITKIYLPV